MNSRKNHRACCWKGILSIKLIENHAALMHTCSRSRQHACSHTCTDNLDRESRSRPVNAACWSIGAEGPGNFPWLAFAFLGLRALRGLASDFAEPAEPGREPAREPARDCSLEVPADVGLEEPGERVPRDIVSESQPNLELFLSTNRCHCGGIIEPKIIVDVLVQATPTGTTSSAASTCSGVAL